MLDRPANAHASQLLVRIRQKVAKGELIARVGVSGEVTGPNVHFGVHRGNRPLDPWPFLTRAGGHVSLDER